jgi:hypothetical protein
MCENSASTSSVSVRYVRSRLRALSSARHSGVPTCNPYCRQCSALPSRYRLAQAHRNFRWLCRWEGAPPDGTVCSRWLDLPRRTQRRTCQVPVRRQQRIRPLSWFLWSLLHDINCEWHTLNCRVAHTKLRVTFLSFFLGTYPPSLLVNFIVISFDVILSKFKFLWCS